MSKIHVMSENLANKIAAGVVRIGHGLSVGGGETLSVSKLGSSFGISNLIWPTVSGGSVRPVCVDTPGGRFVGAFNGSGTALW